MPNQPNLYVPSWPLTHREYMNLVDRVNYLTTEVDRMRNNMPDPGARKERPQPGIISIPSFGGNGFIRVNEDGVIVSYTNPPDVISGLSALGVYFIDTTVRQTAANTTETDFTVKVIEPNTLSTDGDFLLFFIGVNYAANANNKTYRIYFGSTQIFIVGPANFGGANTNQYFSGYLYRRSATVLTGMIGDVIPNGSNATLIDIGAQNFTVANNFRTTAQNGAASALDIEQFGLIILKGNSRLT